MKNADRRRGMRWMSTVAATLALADGGALAGSPTTADCLAASHASLDLGSQHKLRAQRAQLLVCAAASCPAAIRKDCIAQVDELKTEIPTILFAAKDPSGADLSAVKVTMDGETLAEALAGVALAIDPGTHTFTFETPGQPNVTKTFVIQEGQHDRRELVMFGAPAATAAVPLPASASSDGDAGARRMSTQKILALVAGGVGVVGLGIGTAFGVVALSQKSSAQTACPGSACTTTAGSNDWSSAASAGNVSTIALIVGAAGVAGGAVLWFTAPRASGGASAQVGLGPGAVQVRGTF
jgi:hypothetical protein